MGEHKREVFEELVARFVELKNTSELMIDLAYSSLMLNSKDIAEEVEHLEEYVDKLHTDFELLALTSDFKKEEASGVLGLIRLGVATERIADAASEITQACVTEGSLLINKTLKEARVPEETGMWILAIKRGEKSLRPKPDIKIQLGDVLLASGYAEGVEDLKKLASPKNQCNEE
jgi:uncharacterized protein with PhoU and TrkA domain